MIVSGEEPSQADATAVCLTEPARHHCRGSPFIDVEDVLARDQERFGVKRGLVVT